MILEGDSYLFIAVEKSLLFSSVALFYSGGIFYIIDIGITKQPLLNHLQNHHLVQDKFCYLI